MRAHAAMLPRQPHLTQGVDGGLAVPVLIVIAIFALAAAAAGA
jgi:hypothetical protein